MPDKKKEQVNKSVPTGGYLKESVVPFRFDNCSFVHKRFYKVDQIPKQYRDCFTMPKQKSIAKVDGLGDDKGKEV